MNISEGNFAIIELCQNYPWKQSIPDRGTYSRVILGSREEANSISTLSHFGLPWSIHGNSNHFEINTNNQNGNKKNNKYNNRDNNNNNNRNNEKKVNIKNKDINNKKNENEKKKFNNNEVKLKFYLVFVV